MAYSCKQRTVHLRHLHGTSLLLSTSRILVGGLSACLPSRLLGRPGVILCLGSDVPGASRRCGSVSTVNSKEIPSKSLAVSIPPANSEDTVVCNDITDQRGLRTFKNFQPCFSFSCLLSIVHDYVMG